MITIQEDRKLRAVFLFGLYFFVVDNVIGRGVDLLFRTFAK